VIPQSGIAEIAVIADIARDLVNQRARSFRLGSRTKNEETEGAWPGNPAKPGARGQKASRNATAARFC
jgi:hypothetical protein